MDLLLFIFILLAAYFHFACCLLAWVESKISGLTEISALLANKWTYSRNKSTYSRNKSTYSELKNKIEEDEYRILRRKKA